MSFWNGSEGVSPGSFSVLRSALSLTYVLVNGKAKIHLPENVTPWSGGGEPTRLGSGVSPLCVAVAALGSQKEQPWRQQRGPAVTEASGDGSGLPGGHEGRGG